MAYAGEKITYFARHVKKQYKCEVHKTVLYCFSMSHVSHTGMEFMCGRIWCTHTSLGTETQKNVLTHAAIIQSGCNRN